MRNSEAHVYSSFLLRTYPTMKKHNPHTPILIREAGNITPKVWARYGTSVRPNQEGSQELNFTNRIWKRRNETIRRYGTIAFIKIVLALYLTGRRS